MVETNDGMDERGEAVAIIGLACRVPGAETIDSFWNNLRRGVESITLNERLSGTAGDGRWRVGARGLLRDVEHFDAGFFGMSAAEATLTDPQHRVFLECAYEALERAGYDAGAFKGSVGTYAGAGPSGYWVHHLAPSRWTEQHESSVVIGNDKDHLTTRTAYKLGLTGPAITVQTTCSTSLVAVQLAWQALLTYQCDMALAGGVSIAFPQEADYEYQEGFILSPDGHCRAFDARGQGTVPGDGAGVVVLKRLSDAIKDGDHIHAVLLGAAVNNDGSGKIGYTAPGVHGQAQAIAMAHAVAQVNAESIGYVEAHGTGTRLGDPIEVAALTQAFRQSSSAVGTCALGSVKTNIGHLNTAAGVVALIKAVLTVENAEIPPSLHFDTPNPELNLDKSPFFVNSVLRPWSCRGPRRAGVSAFGFGGTNAHVILEEAPIRAPRSVQTEQLLLLSARTPDALDAATRNLREYLQAHTDLDLADVAFTLQTGRRAFTYRRMLVCRDIADAVDALGRAERQRTAKSPESPPGLAFMFPGQGSHHAEMGRLLYRNSPLFRRHYDAARAAFSAHARGDLLEWMTQPASMERTDHTQALIVAFEYALARVWLDLGVKPEAVVGHSLGEYVAACIAGVFTLDDLALLVSARGRLMQELPAGAMISVPLSKADLMPFMTPEIEFAVFLSPTSCVVSGPTQAMNEFAERLEKQSIGFRRLAVTRAFHSAMMDPLQARFHEMVRRVKLQRPTLRCLSGLSGTWMTDSEAQRSSYWVEHLRQTMRLGDCLSQLSSQTLLEVGPGNGLRALAAQIRLDPEAVQIVSTNASSTEEEWNAFLQTAGRLHLAGVSISWELLHSAPRRVPLPTYPFERARYFVDAPSSNRQTGRMDAAVEAERRLFEEAERSIHTTLAIRAIDEYSGLVELLDNWCASLVLQTLREGGVDLRPNAATTRADISKTLKVLPKFERLVDAMLLMAEQDGFFVCQGETIVFTDKLSLEKPLAEQRENLDRAFPQFSGLFQFLEHCAKYRLDAICGRIEAIGVLFPGGSGDFVDACERATVEHRSERIYIQLLCTVAKRIAEAAGGRTLRILEVGGGRGSLTFPLVETLAPFDIEYHFTDLGRVFVEDAREEATRRGLQQRMRFGVFDISKDPGAQGYADQSFDLIVAYNVVHATPNVGETIDMLARLLVPRGDMAIVELVKIRRWDTLTWGLAEGWWYYQDELRRESPLLGLETWEELFRQKKFARVEAYPRGRDKRERMDHGLIVARREFAAWSAQSLRGSAIGPDKPREAARQPVPATAAMHARPDVNMPYVAPRTVLEEKIAGILGRLLGIDRVGIHDDVYLLGADSLIMLRVTDRIRRELGREVPAALAFRGATVERMAAALEDSPQSATNDPVLVPLQPRGRKPPIFFVHPAAGVVFPYVELSRELGSDRPLYGFQAVGLDGRDAPDTTVEQMADRYIASLLRFQPQGPYHIGGFSFGCFVAYEMARRLAQQGRRVEVLALVDEPAPIVGQRPSPLVMGKLLATGIGKSIWPHLHDYFYLSRNARNGDRSNWFDLAALLQKTPEGGFLETFLARSTMANYVPRESMLLALRQPAMVPMFRLFTMHLQAAYTYRPSAYPGAITLFKATRLGGEYDRDPAWGWGMLAAGGVEIMDVPGEHLTVIRKPHVEVLAARLRDCLDKADGKVEKA